MSVALTLRPYQKEAIAAVESAVARGVQRPLLVLPTGCHRAGQRILMFDGSTKSVEDTELNDRLMGPDSTPRRVLQLARGRGPMMRINPVKGEPWVVNDQHILTLVEVRSRNSRSNRNAGRVYPSEEGGAVRDVALAAWRQWSAHRKHIHKLFRVGVEFPRRPTPPLDPYFVGVLLGDGGLAHPSDVSVTTIDREIESCIRETAAAYGLRVRRKEITYHLSGTRGPGGNRIGETLKELGLRGVACEQRFIPDIYRLGSRDVRFRLLAGLFDTDGSVRTGGYELMSKSATLADQAAFVARGLGLAAYVTERQVRSPWSGETGTYYRVAIWGDCELVPCRIARKRCKPREQIKDVRQTGFTVEPTGTVEPYFGFTLDGDGRFLLGDFTVTHNTGKTAVFASLIAKRGGSASSPTAMSCSAKPRRRSRSPTRRSRSVSGSSPPSATTCTHRLSSAVCRRSRARAGWRGCRPGSTLSWSTRGTTWPPARTDGSSSTCPPRR